MKPLKKTLLTITLLGNVFWGGSIFSQVHDCCKCCGADESNYIVLRQEEINQILTIQAQRRKYLTYAAAGAVALVISGYCAYKYNEGLRNLINGTAASGFRLLNSYINKFTNAIQYTSLESVAESATEVANDLPMFLDMSTKPADAQTLEKMNDPSFTSFYKPRLNLDR
jgi:hypothetical protein